jgi:alpha-glucosidase
MMPFLYTTLEEAHRTGVPLFRPLLLNYQQDSNTLNLDDQFMVGSELLVAPILKPDLTSRMVYLPAGLWYDYWSDKKHSGETMLRVEAPLEVAPMFVRGGAIIPLWPEMNYIGERPADPLTFMIYPDEKGMAAGVLYEDDGVSPAYRTGVFRRTHISVSKTVAGYQINLGVPEGSYAPGARKLLFVIKSVRTARHVSLDGKPLARTQADRPQNGWTQTPEGLSVQLADDGAPHQILIK